MKLKLPFALLLFAFFACKTDAPQADNSIAGMEKALETNPSDSLTQALINAYTGHVKDNPTDAEVNSKYLYRAAGLFFRKSQYPKAAQLLLQAIRDYPSSSNTPANMHLLGDLYTDNLRMGQLGHDIYQGLATNYPNYEGLDKVKAKMKAPTPPLAQRIDTLVTNMYNNETHFLDRRIAAQYVMACEVYAITHPKDNKAPELLFKAAETACTIRNYPKALEIYDWILNSFGSYEKSGQALFLKAFTLDNYMKQYDQARPIYEDFLAKYPDNVFAKDTKFLLENLGKSDNDIINSFGKE